MKILQIIGVIFLVFLLIMVRKFEEDLFYDPLLLFFQSDFHQLKFPDIQIAKHLWSTSLRYFLNSMISLGIIHLIFQDIKITKFSAQILLSFFFLFTLLYFYFIQTEFQQAFTAGFYVRRFLLQPVLLLVLVPAIWYYKKNQKPQAIS